MIFFFNLRDRVITESIHESMFRGDVNNRFAPQSYAPDFRACKRATVSIQQLNFFVLSETLVLSKITVIGQT